jgi:putative ABC transport system substrate-binding protein
MLFPKSISSIFRGLRLLACAAVATGGLAHAAALTVLLADDHAPHAEFVRHLRELQAGSGRFDVVRLDGPAAPTGTEVAATEEERANAGVRTRSIRQSSSSAAAETVTVAVGPSAARAALERPGNEPLLLAMLSRLEYENLRASPALRRPERRIGVLLRDPAMADQLALIAAALPQKRRLGVVVTPESEPLLRELQRVASPSAGWELQIESAPDAKSLAGALRNVLPRSDALIVLPDLIGDNQAATLAVLRAGASAGLPVFGASDGMVRSGGLAAAVSTPAQLAQQARAFGQKLANGGGGGGGSPLIEAATPASVRVNGTVARALGLRLPDERELTERVAAAR